MVVHGIRDDGFWTKRVAREIKRLGRQEGITVRAPTPSYGYFSMWDFVKPGGRERAAYWFMERYADVRTHFPEAAISFVGHSNGTYIAARAMELSSAIRFEQVVFAGSVVRCSYPWEGCATQVKRVLNYVGGGDGVVAFLPAAFEVLRLTWLDVGGAGAFGFRERQTSGGASKPGGVRMFEVRFVQGGHGAAIDESFWPEIARFALLGQPPDRKPQARSWVTVVLFKVAPVLTMLGVALAGGFLLLPVVMPYLAARGGSVSAAAAAKLLGLGGAAVVASWLAGRFVRRW